MKINIKAVLSNQRRAIDSRDSQRTSEVSKAANQLQKQGLTRTEALKIAEKAIAH